MNTRRGIEVRQRRALDDLRVHDNAYQALLAASNRSKVDGSFVALTAPRTDVDTDYLSRFELAVRRAR